MRFFADLHVHSKFSRATGKDMTLENIWKWSQIKGVDVVGTGDFTHPEWFREILKKLEDCGNGFFRLKKELRPPIPKSLKGETYFVLSSELSCIYRKNGRTRKIHILVLLPDLASVERLNKVLSLKGSLSSDGRPTFGMDVREIIKMVNDISGNGLFIPAHAWTPHFSLFGSESGFDSIWECFEEESKYIYAIETGLSSDPRMNWRLSALDNIILVSNSDAHSPQKIGREANIFDTEFSYEGIRKAVTTGRGLIATVEFFPEEGKYHFDGHRNCGVVLSPEETVKNKYLCPKCGNKVTVGVMHRIEKLADRKEGERPKNAAPFFSLIPLQEILAEIMSVNIGSIKVNEEYMRLIETYGNEFYILLELSEEFIMDKNIPLLAEALRRVRKGEIHILPGFDGQYGKITIFRTEEKGTIKGQQSLFEI